MFWRSFHLALALLALSAAPSRAKGPLYLVPYGSAPSGAADKTWADCSSQPGDWDRKIAGCTKMLARGASESASNRAIAYNNRGWAYDEKGLYDRAIADLDEAIRLDPNMANAYNNRGNAYSDKGLFDRGIADLDEAIRLDPKNASAYNNRGWAYNEKGLYDRAIADLDEAIRFDPKLSSAYKLRGFSHFKKGELDWALADLDKAIRLNSKYAKAYAVRGDVYTSKGLYDRAIAEYDAALRLEPDLADARQGRAAAQQALAAHSQPQIAAPAAAAPVFTPPPSASALFETRVALVIGNARYDAQSALKNPHNDAAAVAAALRGDGFSSVSVAENLSREALVKALQNFQDEADRADWAVIYFSGHGVEIGGVNYVVPTDARLRTDRNVADEAVSLNRLMDSVNGAKKLKLVILDACRENPFAHAMQRVIAFKAADKGLAPVEPGRATLVVYAARDGQLAQDGEGANSPFAAALAKHLSEPRVEVGKLFRLVTDDVLDATDHRQQPFVYGSLPGREDFYFRP